MSFGSLEVASIPRTQDYTTMKQNEDNKGAFQQMTLGEHAQKQSEQRTREVHSSDNADWYTGQYDAKEKGKNEYAGNGGKHRKKENSEKDGVVVTKQHQGFDLAGFSRELGKLGFKVREAGKPTCIYWQTVCRYRENSTKTTG